MRCLGVCKWNSVKHTLSVPLFPLKGPELCPDRRKSHRLPLQSSPALPAASSRATCRAPRIQRGVLGSCLRVWVYTRASASPIHHPHPATITPHILLMPSQWDHTSPGPKWLLLGPVWPATGGVSLGLLPCASHSPCLAPCWSIGHGRGWAGGTDVFWCGLGTC